jgi:hypothetical protein
VVHPIDIWMAYHPDAKRIARVKRTIDWIVQSFDPQNFPWFRDEFIHPNDLAKEYHGDPLVNSLFAGYTSPPHFDEAAYIAQHRARHPSP